MGNRNKKHARSRLEGNKLVKGQLGQQADRGQQEGQAQHRRNVLGAEKDGCPRPDNRCSVSLSMAIRQARTAKSLTQAQLAAKCNMQAKILQEYESGKAIPDQGVLSRISRALGVKLSAPKRTALAA